MHPTSFYHPTAARTLLHMPHVQDVLTHLENHGISARIVGGAVRDAILGRPICDIDIAARARPETVMQALSPFARTIPTGIKHGTITAVYTHNTFEITSLRSDKNTDGRHAVVAFESSFEEDAARRDFTMNAMYMDGTGNILDMFQGFKDICEKRVRFIGDAEQRIKEDYLRILRFFRMHLVFWDVQANAKQSANRYQDDLPSASLLNILDPQEEAAHHATDLLPFTWDNDGLRACAAHAQGVTRLSKERVRSELFKILPHLAAPFILSAMHQANICHAMISSCEDIALQNMMRYRHACARHHLPSHPLDAFFNLLALFQGQKIEQYFLLTRTEKKLLLLMQRLVPLWTVYEHYGYAAALHVTCLMYSARALPEKLHTALERVHAWHKNPFPLKSSHFESRGLQGAKLGASLRYAKDLWFASFGKLDPQDILNKI